MAHIRTLFFIPEDYKPTMKIYNRGCLSGGSGCQIDTEVEISGLTSVRAWHSLGYDIQEVRGTLTYTI
jgi:hypothetical protein